MKIIFHFRMYIVQVRWLLHESPKFIFANYWISPLHIIIEPTLCVKYIYLSSFYTTEISTKGAPNIYL